MISGLVTLWQTEGEKVEAVTYFIFLGSKITADGDFNHEIERCLLLGSKAMTKIDSILKSRQNFPTNVHIIRVMAFPGVMNRPQCWTIKKAEH